jgi:uncharacterized protein HemX
MNRTYSTARLVAITLGVSAGGVVSHQKQEVQLCQQESATIQQQLG